MLLRSANVARGAQNFRAAHYSISASAAGCVIYTELAIFELTHCLIQVHEALQPRSLGLGPRVTSRPQPVSLRLFRIWKGAHVCLIFIPYPPYRNAKIDAQKQRHAVYLAIAKNLI